MHSQELLDCDQVLIRGVCDEHWAQSIPDHGASSIGCTRSGILEEEAHALDAVLAAQGANCRIK